jgi:hypothetical protein
MTTTMKHLFAFLAAMLLVSQSEARAADELIMYPPVPGLAASGHYKVRVRPTGAGGKWRSAFASQTVCKAVDEKTDAC